MENGLGLEENWNQRTRWQAGSSAQTSRAAASRKTREETKQEINGDHWVFLGKETNSMGETCHNWVTYTYGESPTASGKPPDEHSQDMQWVELKRFCLMALKGDILKYEKMGTPMEDHIKKTHLDVYKWANTIGTT